MNNLYPKKIAMDFWYEFDNFFNPELLHVSPQVLTAIQNWMDRFLTLWVIDHHSNANYPQGFIRGIRESPEAVNAINLLSENQLRIMNKHFNGNSEIEQKAFEYFAQGILFDDGVDEKGQPRRPPGLKIHKMDGIGLESLFGYARWHAWIRATVLVGGNSETWLLVNRLVGLASAIQSELKPKQDDASGINPNNPERPDIVAKFLPLWLSRSFDDLDNAFDSADLRRMLRIA